MKAGLGIIFNAGLRGARDRRNTILASSSSPLTGLPSVQRVLLEALVAAALSYSMRFMISRLPTLIRVVRRI